MKPVLIAITALLMAGAAHAQQHAENVTKDDAVVKAKYDLTSNDEPIWVSFQKPKHADFKQIASTAASILSKFGYERADPKDERAIIFGLGKHQTHPAVVTIVVTEDAVKITAFGVADAENATKGHNNRFTFDLATELGLKLSMPSDDSKQDKTKHSNKE
jgi:hypothetical protein